METVGSKEFSDRFPGRIDELAERFGVGQSTISGWRSGTKKPSRAKMVAISVAGGPLPTMWDVPLNVTVPAGTQQTEPTVTECGTDSVLSIALAQQQYCVDLQREVLASKATMTLKDRLNAAEKLNTMILNVGKLTGTGIVNQRQILDSPFFGQLLQEIFLTLAPWPEALRAVADMCAKKAGKGDA